MSEDERDDSLNTFAAPLTSATIDPLPGNPDPLPPPKLSNVIAKWMLICACAAGPSFFIGAGVGDWRTPAVLGMVIGVLVFVIGYAALEFTTAVQQQMENPVSRRAAWIAYITRVGISVVFPVGLFLDVICGAFAVGISSALTGMQADIGPPFNDTPDVSASVEFIQFWSPRSFKVFC